MSGSRYAGRSLRIVERSILVYSRGWIVFVAGVVEPLLYLLAFQVGFGQIAGDVTGPDGRAMSYVSFVAPALLVASAMSGGIAEATSAFYKLRYDKLYDAMLSTPIGPLDIVAGEALWTALRCGIYALLFLLVMAVFGLVESPWALLLVPLALIVALAFATAGFACVTLMRSASQLDYVPLTIIPLFLFSTTFYPLDVYPPAAQVVVECTPLYQAVAAARSVFVGDIGAALAAHLAYLVVLAIAGLSMTARRLDATLLR